MYNQGGISYNQAPATLDDIKALLKEAISCYNNLIDVLETQNIPELQGQVIALLKQGEIKKAEERMNNALLYENHVSGLKTTISYINNLIGILGSLTENNLERYMTHVASSFYSLNFYSNPSLLKVQSIFESSFKNFSVAAIKQGSYVDSRLISCFSIQNCEESVIKNNIIIIARQSQIRLPDNYEMTALPQTNRNNTASRPSYPVVPTSNPNTSLNQAAIPEMFTAHSSSSKVPNAKFYYPYPDQNLPKGVPVPDIIKKHYHSFVSSSSFCPAIDPPPYPLSLEPFDSDLADSSTKSMNAFSGQPEAPASNSKNGNYSNGLQNVGPLPIVPQPAKNDLPLYANVQQAQPFIPSPFHQRNPSTNSIGMNNPGYLSAGPTVSHPIPSPVNNNNWDPSPRKPINYNKVTVNTANGKQEFSSLPNYSQPINMGNYLPSDNTLNDPSYNQIDRRNIPTAPIQPMPSVMSLSKLPDESEQLDMQIQAQLNKEQKKHQN